MSNRMLLGSVVGFLILAGFLNSFYIVNQTEQALILRFGKPVRTVTEAGLNFKVPFVDSVEIFDRRIITLNAEPKAVILRDQDRLVVDAYVTYRIKDPLRFYQAVRSERVMNQRLENYLETSLREVMGREDLNTLLSPKRSLIMATIRENVARLANGQSLNIRATTPTDAPKAVQKREARPRHHHDPFAEYSKEGGVVDHSTMDHSQMNHAGHDMTAMPAEAVPSTAAIKGGEAAASAPKAGTKPIAQTASDVPASDRAGLGIEIVDVRIMRTDLPKQTSDPIYNRMRSDRQKVAERFRAEGARESQIIRSKADKERTILIADAEKESQILRGMGDAKATEIYAKAFSRDAEFYDFYRSMQAYEKSLSKDDTTLILSPDSKFFKHLEQ
jgi:modulator of FtsH protease HflC